MLFEDHSADLLDKMLLFCTKSKELWICTVHVHLYSVLGLDLKLYTSFSKFCQEFGKKNVSWTVAKTIAQCEISLINLELRCNLEFKGDPNWGRIKVHWIRACSAGALSKVEDSKRGELIYLWRGLSYRYICLFYFYFAEKPLTFLNDRGRARTPWNIPLIVPSATEGQFVDSFIVKNYNVITYLLSTGHDPFAIYFFR